MKDELGKRMKEFYEHPAQTTLPLRMPTIIRLDGKAFHTFTKNCTKPFDKDLHDTMVGVTRYLCKNIQTCVLGYSQSDEISLLLHPYKKLGTCPWYGNNIQKMVSVSASFATSQFNALLLQDYFACHEFNYKEHWNGKNVTEHFTDGKDTFDYEITVGDIINYFPFDRLHAHFDSRVFVIPENEVCNYFIWRQQDAVRNSVQMMAQSLYSHKELQNKNSSELQDMCFKKGQNWNDLDTWKKRGTAVYKKDAIIKDIPQTEWFKDFNIPIFSQERNFIEKYLSIEDE